MTITVVGGGLAGLVASIEVAERGEDVHLREATSLLGGRGRSTTGDFVANHGPHVVYCDGPLWSWLEARGLTEPYAKAPLRGARFVRNGRSTVVPPAAAVNVLRIVRRGGAPDDQSFRDWIAAEGGDPDVASRLCHVFTFSDDPGQYAASFVAERAKRAFVLPPTARYLIGGWGAMVERLVAHARSLGVRITTSDRVDAVEGPTIVATTLTAARRLLGDESLTWTGARTALVDVGLTSRRRDPFVVVDLDTGVFAERYTAPDPSMAPDGHDLVQCQVGVAEDETLEDGVAIIEAVLDAAFPRWREREVWRRRQLVTDASGALDPVGTTWRDRPAIDRGDGLFLCGDMVAAPGFLAEVSCTSAVQAATAAVEWASARRAASTA